MFGLSFLFWVTIGLLRFVFETLRAMRDAQHGYTVVNMLVAAFGGVGISISLFLLFVFGFGPFDILLDEAAFPSFALAILIIWLGCVTLGSYLATRIYIGRPYLVASIVAIGIIITGVGLLILAGIEFMVARDALLWEAIWVAVTVIAALLGAHVSRALNALERERDVVRKTVAESARVSVNDVAIVIAAYNEEDSIGETIKAVLKITKPEHVYVGSDGSKDDTVAVVKKTPVHLDDIQPNAGKAKALTYVIRENKLLERYKAVMFLDAEIRPAEYVLKNSLPLFDDPGVAVIVNRAISVWPKHFIPQWHLLFTAYRVRLWRVLQFCIRYGQTWRYFNASPIIPGGSSIYRTSALKQIKIDVPGLIIEDFNMTFSVHHQKLGRIAYNPNSHVFDQEPFSLKDYMKQVKRWYLGFWQTVRHHGIWPSWFFFSMAFFTIELLIGSVLFVLLPFFVLELVLSGQDSLVMSYGLLGTPVSLFGIIVSVFVIDYIVTIIVAMIEKKPLLLIYWIGFFPLRYIEACIFLYTMIVGLFVKPKADGRWVSPKRMSKKAA